MYLEMRTLIVIVSYNDESLLFDRLDELLPDYDCVVVLNGQFPTKHSVQSRFSQCIVIDPADNLGFASGVNLALNTIRVDEYDLILLLNPDCSLTKPALIRMKNIIESQWDEKVAAWSPQLVDENGKLQRTFWPFPQKYESLWFLLSIQERMRKPKDGFVVGACIVIRASMFRDVGSFDERYFLYSEETDWQRRASSIGYRSSVISSEVVVHRGGGSNDSEAIRIQYFLESRLKYYKKWHGLIWSRLDLIFLLIGYLLRFLITPSKKAHFRISMRIVSKLLRNSSNFN